jgi:hypothetical protein
MKMRCSSRSSRSTTEARSTDLAEQRGAADDLSGTLGSARVESCQQELLD